jgi:hypothetical protein
MAGTGGCRDIVLDTAAKLNIFRANGPVFMQNRSRPGEKEKQ